MSTLSDPLPVAPPVRSSRVGKIVFWSARLTSLPILALVLISAVPALAHLSVAARQDKVLAACLCGIALGLLVGWRWAGLGGVLVVASAGFILAQNDGGLFADPFSVAFALQGLLFLLSWGLNQARGAAVEPSAPVHWARKVLVGLLAVGALTGAAILFHGPEAESLPKGKEVFAGTWESAAGFKLAISPEGKATVSLGTDAKVDAWNLPASTGGTGVFNLYFRNDDMVELSAGQFSGSKRYHIDRWPRSDARQTRMVINGSDPYNPKGGLLLIKKGPSETNSPPSPKSHK